MSGAIGLAPDDPSNGPSFITALKQSGIISQSMFGFYLRPSSNAAFMFGDYDRSYLPSGS
jgi:hypothetical protein